MPTRLCQKIRHALETTPGLTQRGLARRMGLNPAAVNRMLYGRRNIMAEEIPVIESYLGISLDVGLTQNRPEQEYRQGASSPPKGFSDAPPARELEDSVASYVPVRAAPLLAPDAPAMPPIGWALRHPAQLGVRNAFAFYVPSDDMEPRYFRGELLYLHPHRPPETARDCVLALADGTTIVRRIAGTGAKCLRVLQFNPVLEKDILEKDIAAVYAVVGKG